eukprot:TRINITY_DN2198_c0_g1_i3.p1 TRINITY_DN2198_c0_g1~~TRINITY_DN2198_c0_g1_i3.p1  ORF type:complete len:496 (+),score=108.09 TRINITY_DN2198_c0_g1_i3:133-1620(+)
MSVVQITAVHLVPTDAASDIAGPTGEDMLSVTTMDLTTQVSSETSPQEQKKLHRRQHFCRVIVILGICTAITTVVMDIVFPVNLLRAFNGRNTPGFIDDTSTPNHLYGIYWIDNNGNMVKFNESAACDPATYNATACPMPTTDVYDPQKPTVIYAHGWEKDSVSRRFIENNNYRNNDDKYGVNGDLAKAWKQAGWNYGIFIWSRISDEPNVDDVEAKIWIPNGPQGMRWKKNDLTYDSTTFASSFNISMTQIMQITLRRALQFRNISAEFRLVGHSLGTQMVSHYCELVIASNETATYLPQHLVMADPWLTVAPRSFLNGTSAQDHVASVVATLISSTYNVAVILLQTSNIADLSLNPFSVDLLTKVAFVRMTPDYISPFDFAGRHVSGMNLYMNQFTQFAAGRNGNKVPALLTAAQIKNYQTSGIALKQVSGGNSFDAGDDVFVEAPVNSIPKFLNLVEIAVFFVVANVVLIAVLVHGGRKAREHYKAGKGMEL